jgi:hypothetical protein
LDAELNQLRLYNPSAHDQQTPQQKIYGYLKNRR